jgi:hypothetical protein
MTFYPDSSEYRYGLEPSPWPADGPGDGAYEPFRWIWDIPQPEPCFGFPEVNMGWLDLGHPFTTGAVSRRVLERVSELIVRSDYHMTRGKHACPFCGNVGEERIGAAEIRVLGKQCVFAAPNLIGHYMSAHGYRPAAGLLLVLESNEEAEPKPVSGTRRTVPADMLVRRPVDASDLNGKIGRLLLESGLDKQIGVVRLEVGKTLELEASFRPEGTTVERGLVRRVDASFLLEPHQVATGVVTMLAAALERVKEELFRHRMERRSSRNE